MLWILHFFYGIVRNYGLAIIMLTVLVRGSMFPLSRKQAMGARKMQQLQPEIRKIMDKYKDDMEGRSRAQQELFKKHNYHPLSGCWVLFIQMPIFIGLYRSLMVDVELRQAPLLWNGIRWCSNLAAPDMLVYWGGFWKSVGLEWVIQGHNPSFLTMFALGPYFNLLAMSDHRSVPGSAEDADAASHRRPDGHAAEHDEVHDGLDGADVLQGGRRAVYLLHRVEPLGRGRATVVAQGKGRRLRRQTEEVQDWNPVFRRASETLGRRTNQEALPAASLQR